MKNVISVIIGLVLWVIIIAGIYNFFFPDNLAPLSPVRDHWLTGNQSVSAGYPSQIIFKMMGKVVVGDTECSFKRGYGQGIPIPKPEQLTKNTVEIKCPGRRTFIFQADHRNEAQAYYESAMVKYMTKNHIESLAHEYHGKQW